MSAGRLPGGVALLVTCEHGGNRVPAPWARLFPDVAGALATHRGWDPGALPLATDLARILRAPLRAATVTRLLVDLNRSPRHPRVFSEWTRRLAAAERARLLALHHAPHRAAVEGDVAERIRRGRRVVHLGVHSFTPVLGGVARRADLALLYDPGRPLERALCSAWARGLARALPHLAVRRNQPYRGASDGLTTWLRRRFPAETYLGIEIEVNQRLLGAGGRFPREIGVALAGGLETALR
ncbi:MAG TPA: N-formylglutamate amidohydrolase [Longimicrobiales bacterium]|nr:N-formylglutamate amidohydrolase [Longimicrobiales bacterium]